MDRKDSLFYSYKIESEVFSFKNLLYQYFYYYCCNNCCCCCYYCIREEIPR